MTRKVEKILLEDELGSRFVECLLRRSNRARRMNLRVTSRDMAILTLPRRMPWAEGFSFLASQREWLSKKTLGFPSITRLEDYFQKGGQIWLDETAQSIEWSAPNVSPASLISSEHAVITLKLQGNNLEAELMNSCLGLARKNLPRRLTELSRLHGLSWKKYRIGNQKSRWGSCSNAGTISLIWRLILLPFEMGNYVLCHELAHLKHMNHSIEFWDFLESLVPGAKKMDGELRNLSRTVMGLARNT